MKTLCLVLLFHASLQLQCDNRQITAHVGGEFILSCKYDTNRYLYSKKYWCQGGDRRTCNTVVDSEGGTKTTNTHRSRIIDARRHGLYVKVTHLEFSDAGVYWVGIDKAYADIMTSVKVVVTEVPVSKPKLWPLSSLVDKPTCWGRPVTVRCGCTVGTGVRYSWYKNTYQKAVLLHHSADLHLHCGNVNVDSDYHCTASNDISSQQSDAVSVQVLMPADSGCSYVIIIKGQPMYDCAERMTTTVATTTRTPPVTTCQYPMKDQTDTRNQFNQTDQDLFFSRTWTGVPFWYTLLRWGSFATLLIFLCIVISCTKRTHKRVKRVKRVKHVKRVKRKRAIRFKQKSHVAH